MFAEAIPPPAWRSTGHCPLAPPAALGVGVLQADFGFAAQRQLLFLVVQPILSCHSFDPDGVNGRYSPFRRQACAPSRRASPIGSRCPSPPIALAKLGRANRACRLP